MLLMKQDIFQVFISSNFRFCILLSIIVYSLEWKNGVLISIISISIIIVILPTITMFCNKITTKNSNFADRTFIFLPFPVNSSIKLISKDPKVFCELISSRMKNKTVCIIIMVIVMLIQGLDYSGVINLEKPDIW